MEGKEKQQQQQQQREQGKSKGLLELCIFVAALATGTASSILAKVMYAATDDRGRHFEKPIAQTFCMFLAMLVGMPAHWLVVAYKIPFPGYHHHHHHHHHVQNGNDDDRHEAAASSTVASSTVVIDIDATPRINSRKQHDAGDGGGGVGGGEQESLLLPTAYVHDSNNNKNNDTCSDDDENDDFDDDFDFDNTVQAGQEIPWKTYLQLSIPAFFDCTSTALFMVGLLFLNVSVYQLLRGSGIIFVGLLRQYGLKQTLYKFQWVGLWYNVASAVLVGAAALLDSSSSSSSLSSTVNSTETASILTTTAMQFNNLEARSIGVIFMMLGTLLQALQFVLEEKFMVSDEVKVPPLLLFGMEGFWGVIMTLCFLYPIAYYIPGHDHGSFEHFWTAWEMIQSTRYIRWLMILSMVVIFAFNLFCVLVTFLLSSIWHAILDNFRPLTVWCTNLILYYVIEQKQGVSSSGDHHQPYHLGESWTPYSYLQLAGMAVLIYGTAIYNAPDSGSIRLQGEWYSLGMDFRQEYNKIIDDRVVSQIRRSFGSYPSLHGFLNVSTRNLFWYDDGSSIKFGKRARTLQAPASPKLYYAPNSHARNYSSMSHVDVDLSQHSI